MEYSHAMKVDQYAIQRGVEPPLPSRMEVLRAMVSLKCFPPKLSLTFDRVRLAAIAGLAYGAKDPSNCITPGRTMWRFTPSKISFGESIACSSDWSEPQTSSLSALYETSTWSWASVNTAIFCNVMLCYTVPWALLSLGFGKREEKITRANRRYRIYRRDGQDASVVVQRKLAGAGVLCTILDNGKCRSQISQTFNVDGVFPLYSEQGWCLGRKRSGEGPSWGPLFEVS